MATGWVIDDGHDHHHGLLVWPLTGWSVLLTSRDYTEAGIVTFFISQLWLVIVVAYDYIVLPVYH